MKNLYLGFAALLLGSSLIYGYDAERTLNNPVVEPAAQITPESQSYIYSELEYLNSKILKLEKDAAKSDPKKSFSTPKLGGRLFWDSFAIDQDATKYPNRAGLNELRLTITGAGYEVFDYKAEFAFNDNGTVNLCDMWIGAQNVPLLGYFRAGHYNVETGMSYMSGSAYSTLTGIHPSTYSFNLGRKFGVSSEHLFAHDRIRWFVGVFQGQNVNGNPHSIRNDDQGQIYNTRLTAVPYYVDGGRDLLYFGGHYSYVDGVTDNENVDAYLGGTNWLSMTLRAANPKDQHHHRVGAEAAYQRGPFSVKSEAFAADYAQGTAAGTTAEVCYFLTGEHRVYNLGIAAFGAAQVKRPFRPFRYGEWNLVEGLGAWQVVGRYAYTDLGDWRGVGSAANGYGGYQHDWTFGVNWFWTSNIRCIFEYTHSQWDAYTSATAFARNSADVFGTSIRVYW
jgi:phosphate-selective porin OprO/OprP